MAEKTGHTAKKLYDFNTSGVLEVCIKDNWYRVTSNEFRSFEKFRNQISGMIHCSGGAQTKVLHFVDNVHVIKDSMFDVPMKTYEYNGPVYVLLTNQEVIRMDTETIVTNPFMPKVEKPLPNSSRI